ncbi:MAG TPA: T9SS type A sorting domain-containing protein [Bacteroidales bacterium]
MLYRQINIEGRYGFDLYPNPADKYSIIRFKPGGNEYTELRVYDPAGKILIEKTIPAGQTPYQLETDTWNSGLYFVEIRSGQKVSTGKLLVQH